MFAISRAAPGRVADRAADRLARPALPSFAAMFAPSCLAVHVVARYWQRAARFAWRAVGARSGPDRRRPDLRQRPRLMRGTEHGWLPWSVTIISSAVQPDEYQPDPAACDRRRCFVACWSVSRRRIGQPWIVEGVQWSFRLASGLSHMIARQL